MGILGIAMAFLRFLADFIQTMRKKYPIQQKQSRHF